MQTEQIPVLKADEYPGGIWYYEPHTYQPYRYVLGRVGRHPLVCIGINPSTAQPGALDPTLKSVERLAAANGFDSWIMFNVYPQRATDPNDMDRVPDRALCDENLRWLKAVLAQTEPTMWAAWGTLIEKRDYTVYDWKFIGLSHNTVRGAAGGAVLCAELLKAQGYITKK